LDEKLFSINELPMEIAPREEIHSLFFGANLIRKTFSCRKLPNRKWLLGKKKRKSRKIHSSTVWGILLLLDRTFLIWREELQMGKANYFFIQKLYLNLLYILFRLYLNLLYILFRLYKNLLFIIFRFKYNFLLTLN